MIRKGKMQTLFFKINRSKILAYYTYHASNIITTCNKSPQHDDQPSQVKLFLTSVNSHCYVSYETSSESLSLPLASTRSAAMIPQQMMLPIESIAGSLLSKLSHSLIL
ncbi:hypothetical protein CHS0354_011049 [Potamilus streckersoni]|uniref:Uncharacterized protein n=1 Tax=Potamilus streckersoni TaxID=2493646 RepID=A0AAE0WHH4_9BIVA|nr:hypothetical protein CHS0354_011049 [Potamilus streckersoni]